MGRSILNLPEQSSSPDTLKKIHYKTYASRHTLSENSSGIIWRTGHFTTTTSNATLIVKGQLWGANAYSDACGEYVELCNSNGTAYQSSWRNTDGKRYWGVSYAGVDTQEVWAKFLFHWHQVYYNISPGTYEIVVGWSSRNGGSGQKPFSRVNINVNDDNRSRQHESNCEIWECAQSGGLINTNLSQNNW